MARRLTLLYFAWVRERIGLGEEAIEHPGAETTVAGLVARLAGRGGGYAEALGEPERLRAAVDQAFVPFDTPLGEAREVALFPPVTGG
jgi:molybdopterin synthase sulfur carrier subunit